MKIHDSLGKNKRFEKEKKRDEISLVQGNQRSQKKKKKSTRKPHYGPLAPFGIPQTAHY